jgi:hypothetical protein
LSPPETLTIFQPNNQLLQTHWFSFCFGVCRDEVLLGYVKLVAFGGIWEVVDPVHEEVLHLPDQMFAWKKIQASLNHFHDGELYDAFENVVDTIDEEFDGVSVSRAHLPDRHSERAYTVDEG